MSKIIINEIDETTAEQSLDVGYDVVYVPGFSSLPNPGQDGAQGVNEPLLCRSVYEFEKAFGSDPAVFSNDQTYPTEFAPRPSGNMFDALDADPSYVYAKELLQAGIPVIYERLNEKTPYDEDYDVTVENFYDKFSEALTSQHKILSSAPKVNSIYKNSGGNSSASVSNTYLSKVTKDGTLVFGFEWFNDYKIFSLKTSYLVDEVIKATDDMTLFDYYIVIKQIPSTNMYNIQTLLDNQIIRTPVGGTGEGYDYHEPFWFIKSSNDKIPVSLEEYGIGLLNNNRSVQYTPIEDTVYISLSSPVHKGEVISYEAGYSEVKFNSYRKTIDGTEYENVIDTSTELMSLTGDISTTSAIGSEISITTIYDECKLLDKDQYNIKYITSGGYPVFEYNGTPGSIANLMTGLARQRGDCIALIDHTNNSQRDLLGSNSIIYALQNSQLSASDSVYSSMFTPWGKYSVSSNYGDISFENGIDMPASFAYLMCLANSIASNPSWLAIAGASRGKVPHLMGIDLDRPITNSIANVYQNNDSVSINPITYIAPYGQCIWGNRTLLDNAAKRGTTSLSFLNIRNMVCDIKKQVYIACQTLMFDQNTEILWNNFTSMITPLLDSMVTGAGLKSYQIIKLESSEKSTIRATIRIYPVYAVEAFEITLYLSDNEVTVE